MASKEKDKLDCPSVNVCSYSPYDDEIELRDIWNILCRRRLLILVITILITGVALAYVVFSPKVFKIKVNLSPSTDLGIGLLLAEITAIDHVMVQDQKTITVWSSTLAPKPKQVFDTVLKNLQDRTIQEQFWDESKIIKRLNSSNESNSANISKTWFMQNLFVEIPRNRRGNKKVSVSLSGGNSDLTVEVLNDFLSYVETFSGNVLIDNFKLRLVERKTAINKQMEILRWNAVKSSQCRIVELNEQKAIARQLNIVEVPENFPDMPLYARGVKALHAEIDILRNRVQSDSFVSGLHVLQRQVELFNKVDFGNVHIIPMQTGKAVMPQTSRWTKPHVIVAGGVVLGLMVGVFVAFLMNFAGSVWQREREEDFVVKTENTE